MPRHVPDEIIHEILSPALAVFEDDFSTPSLRSPFVPPIQSSSAILLVSKSWLRVATPLLYGVVILRSRGQTQALELALKANPGLGKFIKKLRLEGGPTVALHRILQTAENLRDICISLDDLRKGESASGLCRGLPLINPARVILIYPPFSVDPGKSVRNIVQVLVEYIPKWTNLTTFEMPHDSFIFPDVYSHNETFSKPLREAHGLRTLVLSGFESSLFHDGNIPTYLSTIIQNPSLREIRPKARASKALPPEFFQAVQRDTRLATLLNADLFDVVPTTPFIYPLQLAADPQLEDAIWRRVLSFVFEREDKLYSQNYERPLARLTHNPEVVNHHDFMFGLLNLHPGTIFDNTPRVLRPLLVCKRFSRLGIPFLYKTLRFASLSRASLFAQRLEKDPSLGLLVSRVYFESLTFKKPEHAQNILPRLPRLQGVTSNGAVISWKMFDELSVRCSATLDIFQGLLVQKASKVADPSRFSRFTRMEYFGWNSEAKFNPELTPVDAFEMLHEVAFVNADASFYAVMARMRLPALRSVILTASKASGSHEFFEKHGSKLEQLIISDGSLDLEIFNHCPAIQLLVIPCETKKGKMRWLGETFNECAEHASLERIVFKTLYRDSVDQNGNAQPKTLLSQFDRKPFPALREIEHPLFRWNIPESELVKSPWVEWAEKFQAVGIDLVERPGAKWRARRMFVPKGAGKNSKK
ncbi:hypothetical protein FB45DRAFT_829742 [Roridomyces roridus]|uniref:Uncharacterized protein n=1 Tax=Roridomyces roridus TaxID=1738132 RepID=A0AAD7FR01_9AGAR|nr:hypothetical protein FB45DRAFT_829742 [Roridomyces roridus]